MGRSHIFYRLILPTFAVLLCCGCSASTANQDTNAETNTNSQENNTVDGAKVTTPAPSATEPPKTPASPQPVEQIMATEGTPLPSAAYSEGLNLAASANRLSQTALSPDDWGLIASRWQRAADQLASIDETDVNYALAQQKLVDYTRYAKEANDRIAELQQPVLSRLPATSAQRPSAQPAAEGTAPARPSDVSTASNSTSVVRIPIVRRLHGTPVVQVTFNGERTYDMILDTGASRTLITRQMANDLNIVATERMIAATASDAEVTFEIGVMRSISVGGITLQNARISIGDSVEIGLLGNDFFRGYDITIRESLVELAVAN